MPDRYVVMGNPIAHSKSPEIHRLFAAQTGQDLTYEKLLVPLDGFRAALDEFQNRGGRGANVTVPFKREAFAAMNAVSARASKAQAVNTIAFREDGSRFGDNTDGAGLIRDLRDIHNVSLADARILVLGAGGAVRGLLPALVEEKPVAITVANRTRSRAEELEKSFAADFPVVACGLDEVGPLPFDIIINGTSAGLGGEAPQLPERILADHGICYDMFYSEDATPFVLWARSHGAAVALDGLGMLVCQAAESFAIWRGVRPDPIPVIAALRKAASLS